MLFFHAGPIENMSLVLLNSVFSPEVLTDFKYKDIVATVVYMWTLSKTLAAFANIISKITITITLRQSSADTSLILREVLGIIFGTWIPKFFKCVVPLMGTSAYLVMI